MLQKPQPNCAVNLQYQVIKLAWNNYQSAPESLDPANLDKINKQAQAAAKIMTAVLESPAAKTQQVISQEVDFIIEELQKQFESLESFELSLKQQGLSEQQLQLAIYQDLLCEKAIASQSHNYRAATEQEAIAYYQKNRDKFVHSQRRKVSHILITINNEYAENKRAQARTRIEGLRKLLLDDIDTFSDLALKHSECPSALNEGVIGTVTRGQLYPELDNVLFDMPVNSISEITESEIGLHLLRCHEIFPAGETSKADALAQICQQLNQYRQKQSEKKWLSSLLK